MVLYEKSQAAAFGSIPSNNTVAARAAIAALLAATTLGRRDNFLFAAVGPNGRLDTSHLLARRGPKKISSGLLGSIEAEIKSLDESALTILMV